MITGPGINCQDTASFEAKDRSIEVYLERMNSCALSRLQTGVSCQIFFFFLKKKMLEVPTSRKEKKNNGK